MGTRMVSSNANIHGPIGEVPLDTISMACLPFDHMEHKIYLNSWAKQTKSIQVHSRVVKQVSDISQYKESYQAWMINHGPLSNTYQPSSIPSLKNLLSLSMEKGNCLQSGSQNTLNLHKHGGLLSTHWATGDSLGQLRI